MSSLVRVWGLKGQSWCVDGASNVKHGTWMGPQKHQVEEEGLGELPRLAVLRLDDVVVRTTSARCLKRLA